MTQIRTQRHLPALLPAAIGLVILVSCLGPAGAAPKARKKAPAADKKAPASVPAPATAPSGMSGGSTGSTAPGVKAAAPSTSPSKGELGDINIVGQSKEKLQVGKFDPPAAFNLEDIQNFPEDRLQPVLNNPLTFEEGRDFSTMMDFQEEQLYHPWLPEIAQAPFLVMKTAVEKATRDWTFSIIDQTGATVSKKDGEGNVPAVLSWSGDDRVRDHAAVETVYIPQLATTDKEGYRHTYMGQPTQFSSLMFADKGKTVVELSSKRLFQDKKADLTKEAPVILDKICDVIREQAVLPFAVQAYEADADLARSRQKVLITYFSEKLYVPESQIVASEPQNAEKRGSAIAIITNAVPGGSAS